MKVLLDENLPHQLRVYLRPHESVTTAYAGWSGLKNGALLKVAEDAGYEVLITGDLSLEYQQNLIGRKIALVSLSTHNWRIIKPHVEKTIAAIGRARVGSFVRVECGVFTRRGPKPEPPKRV